MKLVYKTLHQKQMFTHGLLIVLLFLSMLSLQVTCTVFTKNQSMAKRIEAATGIETRATILGHMQRGGSPTAKDRVYASTMGALAVDLLCEGKTNRVVGYRHGAFVDFDIDEALAMKKEIPEYEYQIAKNLSI